MRTRADTGACLGALGLAWLAGMALHLQLERLPPLPLLWGLLALGGSLCGAAWAWPRARALALLGVALVAFGSAGWRACARLDQVLAAELEGEELAIVGVVAGLPQRNENGLSFAFDVESATRAGVAVRVPASVQLGWFVPRQAAGALGDPQRTLGPGQRWALTVKLRRPHGLSNPGGFDQELKLLELGIGATGTVRERPPPRPTGATNGFVIERWRQQVRDAIAARVRDPAAAGLLIALALGDQRSLSPAQWALYRHTGIAHLVSISGLHVTLFAWLAGAASRRLWRRSERAVTWLAAPCAAGFIGLASAAAYAAFSGGGLPAQRTVWMLAVVTVTRAAGLAWPWGLMLLVAAVAVTVLDPWALLQPGFWLSFGAVGLLMAATPERAVPSDPGATAPGGWRGLPGRAWRGLGATLRTQAIATVGLAPPTLVFFQQVSLIGLVANLMAIPLVTLVVLPLALLGVAVPPLWSLAAMVVTPLHAVLSALASVPGGVWSAALAPVWAQWAAGVGAALAVLPLPWRLRTVALVLCVPMLLPVPDTPPPGGFDLIAPDVGQGTAALVRTRAHLLIFDTGPPYGPHGDAGERVLLPLLQRRGETRIDRLVLSHRDADHVGGAATVMGALPVAVLSSSLEPGHALLRLAPVHSRCEAGESWEWDGVRFDMLHPPAAAYERRSKPNARSCVLRVSAPGRSVLLTADIERPQETALLADPGALRSDWLFAPHHGSKTSSSAAFLDAVRPRVAVVQAGYRNRYGHPAADVLARYRSRGIAVVESAACGAFTLRWSDPGTGSCQRDVARRYWHHDAVRGRSVRPAEQE